jgi:hypothetical protein
MPWEQYDVTIYASIISISNHIIHNQQKYASIR